MGVGTELLGMSAVLEARGMLLVLLSGVVLGFAYEISLAGAYLAGVLEDICQSPPRLPWRV
jgi:hypothetical protein